MNKMKKHIQKIKVIEDDFKDFSKIISIPNNIKKSMVLYITTWQEKPDDSQETDTMTTKPEWFKEFEQEQEKRWKEQDKRWEEQDKRWKEQDKRWEEQRKFNERILGLVESLVQRVESIEKRLDKLESRIDNLVAKNNLKE